MLIKEEGELHLFVCEKVPQEMFNKGIFAYKFSFNKSFGG